jgi:hypothetical protein
MYICAKDGESRFLQNVAAFYKITQHQNPEEHNVKDMDFLLK